MLARYYHPRDAAGLDRLIHHPTRTDLGRDEVYVTGKLGEPTGVLVCRPAYFLHELEVGDGAFARARADALANFALGGRSPLTAVFLVKGDNPRMQRWAEGFGAIAETEPGDVLYTLTT
jgi:hypothetical protein